MMQSLTADRARELLDYHPATGVMYWRVTKARGAQGSLAGTQHKAGYWAIKIDGKLYYRHRLAWLIMTGGWPVNQIDHKNCVKGDDRFCNLREATIHQNRGNIALPVHNTSGCKGVYYDRRRRTWNAFIHHGNKKKHIGSFVDIVDAAAAYAEAARKHFGEYARTA